MVQSFALPKFGVPAARRLAVAASVVVAVFVSGFTAPTDSAQKLAAAVKSQPSLLIIAFGSSSTQGVGASGPSATYPAQLQAILARSLPRGESVEVVNQGIGGQDVDDMIKRIPHDVIAPKPDIVIWQTGSNDPLRNVPIDRFEAETRAGVKAMLDAGLQVILMEPQWCPRLDKVANANLFRDSIRKIGDDLKVAVIRRSDLMHRWIAEGRMTKAQMLAGDGLHMSDSGYAELARDIAPQILKVRSVHVSSRVVSPLN